MADVRLLVKEEGRAGRNLITFDVPVDLEGIDCQFSQLSQMLQRKVDERNNCHAKEPEVYSKILPKNCDCTVIDIPAEIWGKVGQNLVKCSRTRKMRLKLSLWREN